MFEFLKRSVDLAGEHKAKLKLGIFFTFIKELALLISFVAVYLGFLWFNEITTRRVWIVFAVLLTAFLLSFITNWYQAKLLGGVFFTIYKDYRLKIGERLKKTPMGYFNEQSLSKILTCFTNILKNLENFSQMAITFVVSGLSVSFFILLGMFGMNLKMGILATVLVLIAWGSVRLLFTKIKTMIDAYHGAEADFADALVDGIRGVPVLRSFPNISESQVKDIHSGVYETADRVRQIRQDTELVFTIYAKIYGTVLNLSSLIMTLYSCLLFSRGEVQLAQALTLCVASFMLFGGLKQLENSAILLVKNPSQLDYLEEVLDIPEIADGSLKEVKASDISFSNVSFAYDKKTVIDDISFDIKEGSKTAIVGPSGSGKTTLINLISRFYDVDKGSIKIGGNDVKDHELDALLAELSLVFQDVYLFNDSIKNNIKFAKPDASDEEIIAVCKKAMCHDFIMEMPDGYDSLVGEGGSSLSGGEKQRISIARALLKDANIVLLDEATSSVDPENEYEIMAAIDELTKGRTVISIAHRLSTVRRADQILLIDEGRLVDEGKHDELMAKEGIYKNFILAREKATKWELGI